MSEPIVLRNPSRLWVPLLTFAGVVLMFAPPIALGFRSHGATTANVSGTVVFALCALWLLRSAWRAPLTLSTDGDGLLVCRPMHIDRFDASRVRRWAFSLPDGPPSREPPATNALLVVRFDEGTTFRGEVTQDQAKALASWFDRHLSART